MPCRDNELEARQGQRRYSCRMFDPNQQQALVTRLNRIEGQVRGIRRMVQEQRLCIEILQQLAAAEAAMNRISLAVLKFHVEKCVPEGIEQGEPERTKRLTELVDIFDRFAR
jgi:CsoR family transcriptional regulator, copper-sensing transcriptional repressor